MRGGDELGSRVAVGRVFAREIADYAKRLAAALAVVDADQRNGAAPRISGVGKIPGRVDDQSGGSARVGKRYLQSHRHATPHPGLDEVIIGIGREHVIETAAATIVHRGNSDRSARL